MNKEIISKLNQYLPTIFKCIMEGFDEAMAFVDSGSQRLSKKAISNIANDFIREKVKSTFPSDNIFANARRLKVLLVDGISLRFKKLNNHLLAGNVSTKQAMNYASQQNLPGMKSSLNLNAGWTVDKTGRKIENVYLTCPKTLHENMWVINVSTFMANAMSIYELPIEKAVNVSTASVEAISISVKPAAKVMRLRKKVNNE